MQAEKSRQVSEASQTPLHVQRNKVITKNRLVLFDFDGTVTSKDTLLEFLFFHKGRFKVLFGFIVLSPVLALYSLGLIANWKAKQALLRYFIGGEKLSDFNSACIRFARQKLPRLIRPKGLHLMEQYLRDKATVVVVSASPENWVGPWCERRGIMYLATQLETKGDIVTGSICGKNCYGPEKVNRVMKRFNDSDYDEIIAYGDSSGDKELLDLAHQKFYKPFRS
jgi:phosphatidylglycerophosphatase C